MWHRDYRVCKMITTFRNQRINSDGKTTNYYKNDVNNENKLYENVKETLKDIKGESKVKKLQMPHITTKDLTVEEEGQEVQEESIRIMVQINIITNSAVIKEILTIMEIKTISGAGFRPPNLQSL